jgi:hypothetical protein
MRARARVRGKKERGKDRDEGLCEDGLRRKDGFGIQPTG